MEKLSYMKKLIRIYPSSIDIKFNIAFNVVVFPAPFCPIIPVIYPWISDIISILENLYQDFDKDEFIKQCHIFQLPFDKKIKELKYLKFLFSLNHSFLPFESQLLNHFQFFFCVLDQIKSMIVNDEIKENDILPSVRTLSKELKISALTVKKAKA